MKTKAELGQFLRKKREAVGLTQWGLALMLGHSTGQLVSNVERGVVLVPQASIRQWARAVGIEPLTLFRLFIRAKNAEAEKKFLTRGKA